MRDRDKRKQELQAELAEIEAEEARLNALTEDKRLAEELHTLQCRWNHTDGCGWYYENGASYPTPVWEAYAHADYLKKARKVMTMLPEFTVDEIIDVVKAVK